MNVNILLAALCTAGAVGSAAWVLIRPRRAPLRRIAPYTEVARSRLGVPVESVPQPVFAGEAVRRLLGPLATTATAWISRRALAAFCCITLITASTVTCS